MLKKKIFVDPGHGGGDPGAVDGIDRKKDDEIYEDELYTEESDVVLQISKLLKNILSKTIEVIMTREEDIFISLSKRADLANKSPANIFVSVHANAAANSQAHGIETLYYPTSSEGKKLARVIQNRLITKMDATNRGIKPRDDLYVLKKTDMPAVLIETGFITNPIEEYKLNSHNYQYLIAKTIAGGIFEYGSGINEL